MLLFSLSGVKVRLLGGENVSLESNTPPPPPGAVLAGDLETERGVIDRKGAGLGTERGLETWGGKGEKGFREFVMKPVSEGTV